MKWKHVLLGIAALALCTYLPAFSVGAFTSPIRDDDPGHIDGGVTCTPTVIVLISPIETPVFVSPLAQPTATPEPTTVPSTWMDAGLWQGAYVLLVNDAGLYCLPELAGCE